jgi:hypothetical protein
MKIHCMGKIHYFVTLTLLECNVQLVITSESIAPMSPKRTPEEPTETLFLIKREDRTLPPNPDIKNINPILTAISLTNKNVRP